MGADCKPPGDLPPAGGNGKGDRGAGAGNCGDSGGGGGKGAAHLRAEGEEPLQGPGCGHSRVPRAGRASNTCWLFEGGAER